MSNPLLELAKEYDKLKTDDERAVWKLAHMDGQMQEALHEAEDNAVDHSGLEAAFGGRGPSTREPDWKSRPQTYLTYLEEEYTSRYGHAPSDAAVKAAAASLKGQDFFSAETREALFQKVAEHDGHAPSRTSLPSGSLTARAAAYADKDDHGAAYGEQGDWMRELATMQHKAGVR